MADKNATGTIIAAGILVTGSTVIRDVHEGKTRAAPIVFGFMMVTALLVISYASSGFARGLAYMSMVGAFVVNGPAVAGVVTGITGNTTSKAPAATAGANTSAPPEWSPTSGTTPWEQQYLNIVRG